MGCMLQTMPSIRSDLLIIMGARVGDRAVGAPHKIEDNAKVVHIDIDPAK